MYVTEHRGNGDKKTQEPPGGIVRKKSLYLQRGELEGGVGVKGSVVRYKCPAPRRPDKELYNDRIPRGY